MRHPSFLPALLLFVFPLFARETVLEDTPSRLVLEVEVPKPTLKGNPAGQGEGQSIVIPGFEDASVTGAPALPWYGFQVATGTRVPSVSIEALEWVEVPLPQGLAGIPRWITNHQAEPARDAALFAAAVGIAPRVSDVQMYRGLRLRKITLPIATYVEGTGRARVLKKFRVTATFGAPSASPAAGVRPWLVQADVKNINGGQYLVSLPRRTTLQRSARSSATALSSGPFLKIKIGDRTMDGFDEDGVYSLTYEAARTAGLASAQQIGKLRLFAGPNDVLSIAMGSPLAPTLQEIPIEVVEGNTGTNPNGTFDEGDRILFYAHGTSLWTPITGATGPVQWEFKHDPYSFDNTYYLDWSGTATGTRLDSVAFASAATTVTMVPHYLRGEKEVGTGTCDPSSAFDPESGYEWFWFWKTACSAASPGPGFSSSTPTLSATQLRSNTTENLQQRVIDSTIWFGAFTYLGGGDDFNAWSGGASLPYENLGIAGAWYSRTPVGVSEALGIDSLQWFGGNRRFDGYTVKYMRRLAWTGASRRIFPAVRGQRIVYSIDSAQVLTGLRVLRIEAGVARKSLRLQAGSNAMLFSDSAGANEDVQYFVYQGTLTPAASALSLEAISTMTGLVQDLYTGDGKNPEYLIIAPQALLPEALKLREYRDNTARSTQWNTAVVRTEDIYREWSGGRLSPVAIRDFLRWALTRWGTGLTQGNLKHVVLYGDGHYDYRNIRNGLSNNPLPNNVPPFNWDFGDANPMSTDDFYVVLDSGEVWHDANSTMDLSVGRLPFQTRDQARAYQNKIERYESPATSGEWRSRILLTGDDDKQREANDGICCHTGQAEGLGNQILANDPGMRKEQVYLFDYPRNSSFLKPEATQDMMNFYNRGVLFSTFFGHGAYNQMADEVLLKTNDGLARLRNNDKLFLMSIFSCTVGRFDKLADEGMSEQFLRVADYGAIGAVSASRESYDGPNQILGNLFANRMFDATTDSSARTMGDALRLAKNAIGSEAAILNSQKYILQGEPVTVIHRPGLGIQLDSVSNNLQSLGCDTVSGRVTFGSGRGRVNLRILSGDVPKSYVPWQGPGNTINVSKPGQLLFERTVDYKDSVFSIGYFLPKNVPFGDTTAKIQIFAWDSLQLRESAVLVANRRILGTTGTCVVDADGLGPRIAVTGCNTKESGGIDFPDKIKVSLPYCLQITVRDTVGGVLAGDGPDEGTTVEVVGAVAPFHPQAGVDDLYLKTYQMTLTNQDLAPGTHTLKVSARDGFGNVGTRQISLQVSADTALRFIKAFNVPNPMKRSGTTFHFQTSLPAEEGGALESPRVDRINFHLRIFNQQGYMVQEFRNAVSGETRWDGKDAWGRQLANGVYFYQVTASWSEGDGSPEGGRRVSKKNVLVISR